MDSQPQPQTTQNESQSQVTFNPSDIGLVSKENLNANILEDTNPQSESKTSLIFTDAEANFSLQDKFKDFRKQRKDKFKNKQYLRNKKLVDRSTKEFQDLLRNKFVETAKKYLGVPYAKRYFKPEDANYNSPLFLDCCALVRQVVHDLREDFGFSLGRWNQAYQYDTLPIDVKLEDMKPGDLVFYSGTYYDSKKKKQRHDMVHVEIFLGGPTGEQTIGARWNNGVVSIFDSYKFVSKGYYDIKFYYKSIDTWLQGICKSYCEQHAWEIERQGIISEKFSVFNASDGEEDADGEGAGTTEETKANGESKENGKSQPRKVFIGKGNNEKLIKSYFDNEKFIIMDQSLAFSNKYDIKWVQLLHELDFLGFKEGRQIVNHISNINIIASKNGLTQTLRDFEANNPSFSGLKMDEFMPHTYRLDILSDELLFINSPNEGLWITKPYNANKGINLKIVRDIAKFKEDFLATKRFNLGKYAANELFGQKNMEKVNNDDKSDEASKEPPVEVVKKKVIIQKYIDKPLLLNNRKFDIRCYMLIASTKPLFVLFHHGYCRLCLNDYSLDVNEKDELDKLAHITNNAIQKKHPDYTNLKETSIWSMKALEGYLKEKLNVSEERIQQIYHEIKKILAHTIRCADMKLDKKLGYFELLGCDVLLDENLKPHLIEINSNPSFASVIEGHKEVIPDLVKNTLDLELYLNDNQERLSEIVKNEELELGKFEVLFNKEKDFIYQ